MNMSDTRTRNLAILGLLALASVIMAFVASQNFQKNRNPAQIGDLVLPEFEAGVSAAQTISVTTREENYSLTRWSDGWQVEGKGGYPVDRNMLADLSDALTGMIYSRQMTQDPAKFDQIGLGDPGQDGAGALLEVSDAAGDKMVQLIIGFKDGQVFVRAPEEGSAWAVETTGFPPLQRSAQWLDLDVIPLSDEDIKMVEVSLGEQASYVLAVKPDEPGTFSLGGAHRELPLLTPYAPNPTALALSGFAPVNADPIGEIDMSKVGQHRVYTHNGLMIEAEIHQSEDDRYWVTFSEGLEADTPDAQAMLEDIESRVAGWAFEISRLDYAVFNTALSDIAQLTD